MPSFSKKIRLPKGGVRQFDFTRIYTVEGVQYFVGVSDSDDKAYRFYMRQIKDSWVIVNAAELPEWVSGLTVELEKAILHK